MICGKSAESGQPHSVEDLSPRHMFVSLFCAIASLVKSELAELGPRTCTDVLQRPCSRGPDVDSRTR